MLYTAIFGGTFNPLHIGHYEMLKALQSDERIGKILLMPDRIPPHKDFEFLLTDQERIECCRIAAEDFSKAELCLIEFEREGKSYTYDTVLELKKRYKEDKLAFVIGGDMLIFFPKWYRYKDLIQELPFIVFERQGDNAEDYKRSLKMLQNEGMEIIGFKNKIPTVSSTEIRSNIKLASRYLPKKIYDFLGHDKMNCDYKKYIEILNERLDDKRFYHSLCVADEAKRLALKYGGDAEKCYLAGLLHDITKNASKQEHLQIFGDFDIMLSDIEKNSQKLWHAISGEAYIKNVLGICDEEILDAVRYHTTAKADMSKTAMILYLADFTSKDRDYPDVGVIRELVEASLYKALIYALSYSINDLIGLKRAIHNNTLEAYNYYISDNL